MGHGRIGRSAGNRALNQSSGLQTHRGGGEGERCSPTSRRSREHTWVQDLHIQGDIKVHRGTQGRSDTWKQHVAKYHSTRVCVR